MPVVSDEDRLLDERAKAISSSCFSGEITSREAREQIIELAMRSPIIHQACNVTLNRMAASYPAPVHRIEARKEAVYDSVHETLFRMIVGTPDRPPSLALSELASGIRFTTWLRRVLYGRSMDWMISHIRRNENSHPEDARIDDAQPSLPDASRALIDIEVETLLQQFLAERPYTRGRNATLLEAWFLSRTLGIKELLPPSNQRVRDALAKSDISDIREGLRHVLTDEGEPHEAVRDALQSMIREHSESDIDMLLEVGDDVLDHLIAAALTPVPPLPSTEIAQVREAAAHCVRPRDTPLTSRPKKVRLANSLVRTWATSRAETASQDEGCEPKSPTRMQEERAEFERSVKRAVEGGVECFGYTPDEVATSLEALLSHVRNARRTGHTG